MSTQKVRPDRGFTERQEFRQRRRMRNRKIGAYVMVAAIIAIADGRDRGDPERTDVPGPGPSHADRGSRHLRPGRRPDRLRRDEGVRSATRAVASGPSTRAARPTRPEGRASPMTSPRRWCGWTSTEDAPALAHGSSRSAGRATAPSCCSRVGKRLDEYLLRSSTRTEPKPACRTQTRVWARHAAISPDGSRVVFAGQGLTVVDIERDGGRPSSPVSRRWGTRRAQLTFSPDGTQIAYLPGTASRCGW